MDSKYEQERSTLLELPILKHFDESKGEIALKTDVLKKGQKSLFWALALGLLGVGGYLVWTYIIPPLFTMLGQAIALSATGVFLVFLVMMFPVIMKGLRFATKNIHKALIQSNPFNELEEQKLKMIKNREVFKNTKAKLKGLKNEMEIEAGKSEKEAKEYQEEVLSLQRQSEKLSQEKRTQLDEMGFDWSPSETVQKKRLQELEEFKKKHGNCEVPFQWKENKALGSWVRTTRVNPHLSSDVRKRLDHLGFDWSPLDTLWKKHFEKVSWYKSNHGEAWKKHLSREDEELKDWVVFQKEMFSKGKLKEERREKLKQIGIL